MKKKGKKKLIICILLLLVVIIEFIAFIVGRSKGQNTKDVALIVTEYDAQKPLTDTITIQSKYDDNGYYIALPETINNKIALKYYIEEEKDKKEARIENVTPGKEYTKYVKKLSNIEINDTKEENETTEKEENEVEENTTKAEETENRVEENEVEENKTENEVENETNEVNDVENEVPQNEIDSGNDIESNTKIKEMLPGEIYYLSDEEFKDAKINIKVVYDSKEVKGINLYSQIITAEMEKNTIQVSGYFPNQAEVVVSTVESEKVINSVNSILDENTSLAQLLSIKILVDGKEFKCEEYGETVKVRITVDDSKEQEYKVFEIKEKEKTSSKLKESKVTKLKSYSVKSNEPDSLVVRDENNRIITSESSSFEKSYGLKKVANDDIDPKDIVERDVVVDDDAITFETKALGTIALLRTMATNGTETDTIEEVVATGAKWDGTVATSFCYGNGTSSKPYLILEGSELAYLANQVNSGNAYDGVYFQLAGDIDLNNRVWTPIGNTNNSFRGIFDGAGHSISNGIIETAGAVSTYTTYNYGIFGTIQGNTTTAEVKNTEFNNITVHVNNLANNSEVHVGIVTGTMYRKSKISNVLVKNGNISVTRTINVGSYTMALLVGGIAGEARNTSSSTADPGEGNRYAIENCYVSLTVDGDSVASSAANNSSNKVVYVAQINTGGVIGRIRSQNVWPKNCLVEADLSSGGFIGPIFGAVLNNTSYTSYTNLDTLWQGNDAAGGSNLTMTSYYTTYRANSTSFTSSYQSGTTPSSTTYRRNAAIRSNNGRNYYIGYLQGVNKASRLANESSMLANFNNYYSNDNVTFVYSGGEFSLNRRLTAGVDDNGDQTYTITVDDPYNATPYTYEWYINNTLDSQKTSATEEVKNQSFQDSIPVKVIISDGTYYSAIKFSVPRLFVRLEFSLDYSNPNNIKINAQITGPRNSA